MKKMLKRLTLIVIMVTLMVTLGYHSTNVYAADFIDQAMDWQSKADSSQIIQLDSNLMGDLADMVNVAGTAVISIVSVVLGIKYMIGSATDKSEVKQQLITFLVACLFFFGWSNLSGILITGATYNEATGTYSGIGGATQLFIFSGVTSIEQVFAKVFAIVLFFGKIVAFIATMVIGVKYIFSGADGKAALKEKGPMYIIGILMIFCTLNILTFISDAINATF